jgi:hypothetical protein
MLLRAYKTAVLCRVNMLQDVMDIKVMALVIYDLKITDNI